MLARKSTKQASMLRTQTRKQRVCQTRKHESTQLLKQVEHNKHAI